MHFLGCSIQKCLCRGYLPCIPGPMPRISALYPGAYDPGSLRATLPSPFMPQHLEWNKSETRFLSWCLYAHGAIGRGGGGTFQVRVGPVLTQHMRGWGGTFHRLCWGRVNTSYPLRVSIAHTTQHNTTQRNTTHNTTQHNTTQHNTTQHNTTHNTTQHNTTQHNTTQHTTQHNTTQHNTTQHTTQHNTQHNTTQHNTTQHNTTQHNTTQHNTKSAGSCVTIGGTEGGGGTFQVRVGPVLTQHRRGWGGTFYLCVGRPC